jgi:two-component system LytT family response regulator
MRAIIVDDEIDARENLGNLLGKYCEDVEVVNTADSAVSGFEAITSAQPDLVFMDVQMPDGTGIELLEKIDNINFEVIFVTAYDEYAIKAIKFAALDYLLKPINPLDLKSAVEKAQDRVEDRSTRDRLQVLLENQGNKPKKIALRTSEGINYVEVDTIIRCEANDTYTTFHFTDRKPIMISGSLKEYERMLEGAEFFRVHQSHLVNMNHVAKYAKGSGGSLTMADGSIVGVARAKKTAFLAALESFNG